jgi:DNA-binding Lrp family transcriptional regulator
VDNIDRSIINHLQDGFPVCDRPYQQAARQTGIDETELLSRLQTMLDDGRLSRFGPMFNAEKMGGAFTLCAMSVPNEDFDAIAQQVNDLAQVAHNYERDHVLNMWFVLATETEQEIAHVIGKIEAMTRYPVYNFPKLDEYYVGLRFDV